MTEWSPDSYVEGDFVVFGGSDPGAWGGPDEPNPVSRAARIQDQVARFIREHLGVTKETQIEFATRIGMPRAKLNRLLHGREWARLHELERMLDGCGQTMTSVSWAIGDVSRQPERVRLIIAEYLHEQLAKVEEGTVRT